MISVGRGCLPLAAASFFTQEMRWSSSRQLGWTLAFSSASDSNCWGSMQIQLLRGYATTAPHGPPRERLKFIPFLVSMQEVRSTRSHSCRPHCTRTSPH